MLAEQVEGCRLEAGDGMHRRSQVERLRAAPTDVAVGEVALDAGEQVANGADRLADERGRRVGDDGTDRGAARHLADAGAVRRIGDDDEVAGEERTVRAAQV